MHKRLHSQGKVAVRFIERELNLTRPDQGAVAMLLKVDFDSGLTRRRLFADCPARMTKLALLKSIEWFKSVQRPQRQPRLVYLVVAA